MPEESDGKRVLAMLRLDGFSVVTPDLFDGIASRMRLARGAGE